MREKTKKTNLIIRIGRAIKIKHLVLLIVLFIANSYAWFIFSTKVSLGITAHIASWSIHFTAGDGELVSNMSFFVDRVYPGMEEAEQSLYISNTGTEPAVISYDIEYVRIFEDEYEEGVDDLTSEDLEDMLKDDYPFKFDFVKSSETVGSFTGTETFKVTLNWDYESGDDEADTEWGEKAYAYYAVNPDDTAIEVRMKIHAIQQPSEDP